jgi:hypothetical protein
MRVSMLPQAITGKSRFVKLVTRKSYGFRTPEVTKLVPLRNLGRLPESKRTQRFD